MSEIIGVDGKILNEKKFEVNGFEFDAIALQNNPFLMMMAVICIDPTPLQEEFLEKAEVTFVDINNKQIFPKLKEIDEDEDFDE